jgi:hypothetical protein
MDSLQPLVWRFETPEEHWAEHDRRQVNYWLTRPASERLARANALRERHTGAGAPREPFEQFCRALRHAGADFVIVGSEAVALHGVPRFSLDFDVLVRRTTANLFRVKAALESIGGAHTVAELDPEVWMKSGAMLRVGVAPAQIDVLLGLTGVTYEQVSNTALEAPYGDLVVRFMGRDTLIANKLAVGRPKDLADVAALRLAER